jgi:DNA-binding CsgD family transcriptional regulator
MFTSASSMIPSRLDNGFMVSRVSSPVFVGRGDQLDGVVEALRRAANDDPTFVLVAGEAGVGKTRFVEEVATKADDLGARTLIGGCVQMGDDAPPYAPIVEALRGLAAGLSQVDLGRFVGTGSAELAALVPGLVPTPQSSDADGEPGHSSSQGRLLEALVGLFRRLASERPLLVIIEDIHWADASTIALLGYLTRNLSGPIVLVATYRIDELHRRHPLLPFLAEAERRRPVERIDLRPFDRHEIEELVRAIRNEPPDRDLVDQLYDRSDGNAFYVEELLAARATSRDLPTSLHEVLSARVMELSDPTQEFLRQAAAAGPTISISLLATVARTDEVEAHARLREAVEHHILTADAGSDRLTFRHALMRESIYESLLPWERTRLHSAFAVALEAAATGDGDASRAAELAFHWYAAHELPKALQAATRAAQAFEAALAPAAAHAQYERALELWDQVPDAPALVGLERLDLLERAAAAASATTPGRAVALINAAIALVDAADSTRAGLLWELLGGYLWASGDGLAAVVAGRTAVELVPIAPASAARARVLGSLGRWLSNVARFREAQPLLEEATAVARAANATAVEAYGLNTLGLVLGYLGDAESGLDRLGASREIAMRLASAEDVARADANQIDLLLYVAGRFAEAATVADEAFAYAEEHHVASFFGVYDLCEGAGALTRLGRWPEADSMLERASRYRSSGIPEIFLNLRLASLEVGRGAHAAARARLALIRSLMGTSTDPQWALPLLEVSAELALWQGRPNDARREIAETFDRLGELDAGNISRTGPIIAFALRAEADQAIVARGHRSEGEVHDVNGSAARYAALIRAVYAEILRDRPSQVRLAAAYLSLCDAEIGRLGGLSAAASWSAAAAAFGGLPMPYVEAYARWREAQALLAARETRRAGVEALAVALGIADQLGAEPLRREIAATGRRARIDVDAARNDRLAGPKPVAPFGLTARELEVLALLVGGGSNREIADELFISENTAGVHVSNILGKLGVSRRMEAAAIAHQLGLINGTKGTVEPA